MADQEEYEEQESVEITDVWHRIEYWFEDNKQTAAIGGGVLAILIVAIVFVFAKWLPDRNLKAQREMYQAEMAFARDSFDLAINGNGAVQRILGDQKEIQLH